MQVVVCVDERNGMSFNKRRQSRDRVVYTQIETVSKGKTLWIHPYSAPLFSNNVCVSENFLQQANKTDICFVENQYLQPYIDKIETLILFRWQKVYPVDRYLDLDLTKFQLQTITEFAGYSHDCIVKEVYHKKGRET